MNKLKLNILREFYYGIMEKQKERSPAQIERQDQEHREKGRYAKVNPCYVCGKSAGVNYYSHPDTDVTIGDELLCLCKSCMGKLEKLDGKTAVKIAFQNNNQNKISERRYKMAEEIENVDVNQLKIGENSRLRIHSNLSELMESIKQRGLLQPILVRSEDNLVICGNRRLEACKKLGLKTIPVIYKDNISNKDLLLLNLVENIQRKDINSIEIGRICDLLINQGLKDSEIAVRLGISQHRIEVCIVAYKRTPEEFRNRIAYVMGNSKDKHNKIPENVFWSIVNLDKIKKMTKDDFKMILEKALKYEWTIEHLKALNHLYRSGFSLSLASQMIDKFVVKQVKICFDKEKLNKDMARIKATNFSDYIKKILNGREKDIIVI